MNKVHPADFALLESYRVNYCFGVSLELELVDVVVAFMDFFLSFEFEF